MNTLKAVPTNGKVYSSDTELIQDWIDGVEFKMLNGNLFSVRDYDLLANTYNYDDICIMHEDLELSSATFIPLFKTDGVVV